MRIQVGVIAPLLCAGWLSTGALANDAVVAAGSAEATLESSSAVSAGGAAARFGVRGFAEIVVTVRDLGPMTRALVEVGGYEVRAEGMLSPAIASQWELGAGATGVERVLCVVGGDRGCVRLVRVEGASAEPMRPGASSWDTGGIFDFNVRALDVHQKMEELRALGWTSFTEPVEFSFGPFIVREVLARAPDSVVIAMIERVQPELEGWPDLKHLSRVFNSTQIVRDFDASLEFFLDKLGFELYLEHEGASSAPGPTVLGLPHNLADKITRSVVILSPAGDNDGSVELISYDGALTGADHSGKTSAANLGMLSLRFPVGDLDGYRARLVEQGVEATPIVGPAKVAPWGAVRTFRVVAPEGAWLEFFQRVE